MQITPFAVTTKGVGRKDYSRSVERSTQPFLTPTLRQDRFNITFNDVIITRPFPIVFTFVFTLPQEDGSFDFEASSIGVHFFDFTASLKTNSLCVIGLFRYASYADWLANILAERSPQAFGYGRAKLKFSRGIPSKQGSVYSILAGGWPETPTYEMSVDVLGLLTDLTPPWMVP